MAEQLWDVAAPVVGAARNPWDVAVDDALKREYNYTWWLDQFQNTTSTLTDDQLLSAAMTDAAAMTQPPVIKLGPRDHSFTQTGRNVYPGFALCGASDAGLQATEQNGKAAKSRALFNGGVGTSSMFSVVGTIYNPMTCHNIAWRSTNNSSQWLHAPIASANMYGATWGNLQFTGFKHCIGQPGDAATITLSTMWGAWNIPNMADEPMSMRGSDNWLVPDEANVGWNAAPVGKYLMRLENMQKTMLRGFYWTCRVGGSRALLVDNQGSSTQGSVMVSDCVIEGQNLGEPAGGALIYVNGAGVVNVHHCAMNFAMGNPTPFTPDDTAYIMANLTTNGVLNVSDINVTRATGVSQDVPFVAQTGGGRVYVRKIIGMPGNGGGQVWTDLPAVTSSAGYMETDRTVRVI
jgi:hypothetical protein